MANKTTIEDVRRVLKLVIHPLIKMNVYDLGIIKDISLEGNLATITVAFPFMDISAAELSGPEFIIQDISETVQTLGLEVDVQKAQMDKNDLLKFLAKSKEARNLPQAGDENGDE